MDERYFRPAISPDEAGAPIKTSTVPSARHEHPSLLRVRMREAQNASNKLRGSNVNWQTTNVAPSRNDTPQYNPNLLTNVKAEPPMKLALREAVKRIVSKNGEYTSLDSELAGSTRGAPRKRTTAEEAELVRLAREAFDKPKGSAPLMPNINFGTFPNP